MASRSKIQSLANHLAFILQEDSTLISAPTVLLSCGGWKHNVGMVYELGGVELCEKPISDVSESDETIFRWPEQWGQGFAKRKDRVSSWLNVVGTASSQAVLVQICRNNTLETTRASKRSQ